MSRPQQVIFHFVGDGSLFNSLIPRMSDITWNPFAVYYPRVQVERVFQPVRHVSMRDLRMGLEDQAWMLIYAERQWQPSALSDASWHTFFWFVPIGPEPVNRSIRENYGAIRHNFDTLTDRLWQMWSERVVWQPGQDPVYDFVFRMNASRCMRSIPFNHRRHLTITEGVVELHDPVISGDVTNNLFCDRAA